MPTMPAEMADNAASACSESTMPPQSKPAACPCGGADFAACCGPYLSGDAVPPSAELLMRSRYSAYTLGNEAYLRATWHPDTLPAGPIVDPDEKLQWLGLEVKSALRLRQRKANLPETPGRDTVEFVARYKIAGRAHRLHEVSRFVREGEGDGKGEGKGDGKGNGDGKIARWLYLDGSFPE